MSDEARADYEYIVLDEADVDEPTAVTFRVAYQQGYDHGLAQASRTPVVADRCCDATEALDGHWLVERHTHCTCGGSGILSPAHQPGCGLVPLVDLRALDGWIEPTAPVVVADVDAIARHLGRIHFDGTGCGTYEGGACVNCYGPSPMSAQAIAQTVAALLRGEPRGE